MKILFAFLFGLSALFANVATTEGDLVTTYEYDLLDRVVKETEHDLVTITTYDADGNKSSLTKGGATEFFYYDSYNRLIRSVDALGFETHIIYDDANHQKTTIDPLRLKTVDTFNSQFKLIKREKGSRIESYDYDGAGNLTSRDNTLIEYDSQNRLIKLIRRL